MHVNDPHALYPDSYVEREEFDIVHEIDESFQELPTYELGTQTNLMEAIEKGALFLG